VKNTIYHFNISVAQGLDKDNTEIKEIVLDKANWIIKKQKSIETQYHSSLDLHLSKIQPCHI
jgi:hypothetical protein